MKKKKRIHCKESLVKKFFGMVNLAEKNPNRLKISKLKIFMFKFEKPEIFMLFYLLFF